MSVWSGRVILGVLLLLGLGLTGCGKKQADGEMPVETDADTRVVGAEDRAQAEQYFRQGAAYYEREQYDQACGWYLAGLKKDPRNAVGYNLLGMVYRMKFIKTGDPAWRDKEEAAFLKAVKLDPRLVAAVKNLAVTLFQQGRRKMAAQYLRRALELYPHDPERELMERMMGEAEGAGSGT